MKLEWSVAALADLDRFAEFLRQTHPQLADHVAAAIVARAELLIDHPKLGRPLAHHPEYRQIVLRVLNADYVFQYRLEAKRLVVLRVSIVARRDRRPTLHYELLYLRVMRKQVATICLSALVAGCV